MFVFVLTIFTSALLLFQVQPLIAKYILPWFGGTPGVWTTCMLFFQTALLGGYGYAHWSSRKLTSRKQAIVHLGLLGCAVLVLPIIPSEAWKPADSNHPAGRIMALLMASVGLPYLALSSTGPLLQSWFGQVFPGRSPYRLYSLSNIGSLLGLLGYPFWFEVTFTRRQQAEIWSIGFVFFAVVSGICAWRIWRQGQGPVQPPPPLPEEAPTPPTAGRYWLWMALPACASVLLLAVTNKLCQDMAVMPFFWVLPLSLYLASFIVSFDSPRWYSRLVFGIVLGPCLAAAVYALYEGVNLDIVKQSILYSALLFVCCMVCHGELYRLKPHPKYLTAYYLVIALGGACGGLLVAVLIPLTCQSSVELPLGLGLCLMLFFLVCLADGNALRTRAWKVFTLGYLALALAGFDRSLAWLAHWAKSNHHTWRWDPLAGVNWSWAGYWHWIFSALALALLALVALRRRRLGQPSHWHGWSCSLLGLAWVSLTVALVIQGWPDRQIVASSRNFYGLLSVWEYNRDDPQNHYLLLQHGGITHGLQLCNPDLATRPTSYYTETSGVGLAVKNLPRKQNRVIGMVGLGTGTLAAYGQVGDLLCFYEINPAVPRLARAPFSYLSNCAAQVEIVMGDARLSLEREPSRRFDLLALDAFSSDAIPVHLLTREAFEIYLRHMRPEGVIAVHISNHFLDLAPVVANLAAHFNLKQATVDDNRDEQDPNWWHYDSTWILLTRSQIFLNAPDILSAHQKTGVPTARKVALWTDDFSSLVPILK